MIKAISAAALFLVAGFASAVVPILIAPHAPSSTQPADVTSAIDAGTAIALIEVSALKPEDQRPVDGNLNLVVTYKVLKSSGKVPEEIRIIQAFGGMRPPNTPAPVLSGVLHPNPLAQGQRYWIVFNDKDFTKYQQGVVAWWPEKSAPAAAEAAVAAKKFDKQPSP